MTLEFCPILAELVRTQRITSKSGKVFDDLGVLSTVNNLLILRNVMLDLKPLRTLEIGLSFGASCLVLAASHRDVGHRPIGQHMALDPFQLGLWDNCGLNALEAAGLSGYVDFRPAFSSLELPKLLQEGSHFDLVYIDGSHLIEDVFVDAYFVMRLLSEGGIAAFDDSTNPHVRKVLRFIRTNCQQGLTEVDVGSYRPTETRTLKYQCAKILGKVQMTAFRRIGPVERVWNAPFRRF